MSTGHHPGWPARSVFRHPASTWQVSQMSDMIGFFVHSEKLQVKWVSAICKASQRIPGRKPVLSVTPTIAQQSW